MVIKIGRGVVKFVQNYPNDLWMPPVSLVITLFQGSTSEEINLGLTVMILEGIPQLLVLAMVMTRWEDNFNYTALELFSRYVTI